MTDSAPLYYNMSMPIFSLIRRSRRKTPTKVFALESLLVQERMSKALSYIKSHTEIQSGGLVYDV
jgi:hypothetical protein